MIRKALALVALWAGAACAFTPTQYLGNNQSISSGTISTFNTSTMTATAATLANLVGMTNGAAIPAGDWGQIVVSSVPYASAFSYTGGNVSVATMTLTAGYWEIFTNFGVKSTNASTSLTESVFAVSTTANAMPGTGAYAYFDGSGQIENDIARAAVVPGNANVITMQGTPSFANISSPTTYYLVGSQSSTVSTLSLFGAIFAVRIH